MSDLEPPALAPNQVLKPLDCEADGQITKGFAIIRQLSTGERIQRAGKIGGALFLVGLFTIFIPILHFVLPPLFLILAAIFGTTTWWEETEVVQATYICPVCKKSNQMTDESDMFPRSKRCDHCQFTLHLKAANSTVVN